MAETDPLLVCWGACGLGSVFIYDLNFDGFGGKVKIICIKFFPIFLYEIYLIYKYVLA